MLRREIALTVEQMRRLKDGHDRQFRRLLKLECYVDTELLQLDRQHRYEGMPGLSDDRLKQRLFEIEKQRRDLSLRLEEKTQTLETKLLELINKHRQLDI